MPRADGPSGPAIRCGPPYSVKWSRARLPLESGKPLIRRVRNAGEGFVCGPVQLKRLGWTIAVCHASAYGLPGCDKHTGAAGAAFRPVFRTPSFQGMREKEDRLALGPE